MAIAKSLLTPPLKPFSNPLATYDGKRTGEPSAQHLRGRWSEPSGGDNPFFAGGIPLYRFLLLTPFIRRPTTMPHDFNASLLGLVVNGDLGGLTIYTDRFGKKVVYEKSPPEKPPSDLQVIQRQRFRLAQAEYAALTSDQKLDYETLAQRASLCLTGQNLFIHVALVHSYALLNTLQHQWALDVFTPTAQ